MKEEETVVRPKIIEKGVSIKLTPAVTEEEEHPVLETNLQGSNQRQVTDEEYNEYLYSTAGPKNKQMTF